MYLPQNTGGDFELAPAGTHLAVCYRVIDLGTQAVDWQGQTKHQRKVLLSWELPDEQMSDGRPFSIGQRYTLSSSEKARLRQDLESWRGRPFTDVDFDPANPNRFNIKKLIGVGCLLTVVHTEKAGKSYANIKSVAKLMKGQAAPPPVNPTVYFSLDEYDEATFQGLSEGLRKIIAGSPEFIELSRAHLHDEQPQREHAPAFDDSIPFAPCVD